MFLRVRHSNTVLRGAVPSLAAVALGVAFASAAIAVPDPAPAPGPAAPPLAAAAPDESVALPLRFDRYYRYDEIEQALRLLAGAYPTLATLRSMGRSYEGRDLSVLEITNQATGPIESKAAIYIDGNTHGNEIQGSEVALYTAQHLLRSHGRDPYVTRLVDERAFLIAPCVNPDGREAFFREPNTPHSSRGNRRPFDDDGDGRVDEDGYEDVDGDGQVLTMRRRDPLGAFRSGDDPRLVVQREGDQAGEFEVLGTEGIDNDGDGRFNEDPPGGVDLNRNFPTAWEPRHVQPGAGDYPLSEPETRATALYILSHPNIAAVQSYHNFGAMILRPPASADDRDVPGSDLRLYEAIGRRGERLLPGYRYLQTFLGLYAVRGGFLDWTYLGLGIFTFSNELWDMPDYDHDGDVTEREALRFSDEVLQGRGYAAWRPMLHPQLGVVEVGGWERFARRIPPAFMIPEMAHRNCLFTLHHADAMPRVAVGEIDTVPLAGSSDTFKLRVECRNDGFLPTASGLARRLGLALEDVARLSGPGVTVLASGIERPRTRREEMPAQDRPAELRLGNLDGRSRVVAVFLIRGGGPIRIELASEKGGRVVREIALQ